MKRALFFLLILTLALLAGCGREAKEPVPEWPDRLAGEYDDTLTFTYRGTEPALTGADSLTGRMTALFSLEDGDTLALGWRRVAGAEAELLEDFLAEAGGTAGVWAEDSSAPSAAEAYVSLGGRWYCFSASCPGKDRDALLALLDGTVSAQAGEDRFWPRLTGKPWLAELPWEEDWTCLILGQHELEPGEGKDALRALFSACSWVLAEPDAEEEETVRISGKTYSVIPDIRQTWIWSGNDSPLRFHLRRNGDVWWNGDLWRPVGEGAGETLLAGFEALRDSGISIHNPPPLTYSCGEAVLTAHIAPTFSWSYISRAGVPYHTESDGDFFENIDWLDGTRPALRAEGVVRLSFPTREPDRMTLGVFTGLGKAPVELRDGGFVPYAGTNTYFLSVYWEQADQGGYGGANYILLIEGACAIDLPESDAEVSVSLLAADAYGCSFTLENRAEQDFLLPTFFNTGGHPLFRKTASGSWEWVKPIRAPEDEDWSCNAGNTLRLGLDWSRALGPLEAGEYALLFRGQFMGRKGGLVGEPVYLPLYFTLGEDALPEPPGPLAFQGMPDGFSLTLRALGPHRWTQTFAVPTEGRYIPERDFSLFREEADGTLTHILPRYHLPYGMNHPVSSTAELDVDLAAQYGSLKAGTYVIRRRFLRREEGETTERPFDRSWRTFPEERILYADTRLYLDRDLAASTREVEPASISFYAGEDQVLPVIIQNGRFTSTECRFAVKNLGEETISFGEDEDTLYYLEGNGEWLPVANGRHLANGLIPVEIPPGESREWRTAFQNNRYFKYGPLPKGVYRLVFQAWLEEDYQTRYPLVVEFSIREDGSGMYTGA